MDAKISNVLCFYEEESNDTPLFTHQTNNMDWFYNLDKETQDNMLSCFNQALQNHKIFNKDVIKIMELKFKITPEQIKNLYEFQKVITLLCTTNGYFDYFFLKFSEQQFFLIRF